MFDSAQELVIDRAKHPRFGGHLENSTNQADGANQSCGDEIHLELVVQEGKVKDVRHQTRSCTVCAASADLLAEWMVGKSLDDLQELSPKQIQEMINLPLSPVRLKCVLLPLETARCAIQTSET